MNPDNSFYGHRRILAREIAWPLASPGFRAHIQHGWAPFSPLDHYSRVLTGIRYLSWSEHDAMKLASLGVRRLAAIGAPFLYLRTHWKHAMHPPPGDGSMIVYPAHGWERQAMHGPHAAYINEIAERATGPVTVCLYWVEHANEDIRRRYAEAGFRVITHGCRADPLFSERQISELLRHDVIASNHVSTALWYGGALSRRIVRFGPEFIFYDSDYRDCFARYQRRRWPQLEGDGLSGTNARVLADEQLGARCQRHSRELRELLSPFAATSPCGRLLAARAGLDLRAKRLRAVIRNLHNPRLVEIRNRQIMASYLNDTARKPITEEL